MGTKAEGLGATVIFIWGLPHGSTLSLLYNIIDEKGTSFMYLPLDDVVSFTNLLTERILVVLYTI